MSFLVRCPLAWLTGLILNTAHFSIIISVLVFSVWKNLEIFRPHTVWYFLGIIAMLCVSACTKVIVLSIFDRYFHGHARELCPWCGRIGDGKPDWPVPKLGTVKANFFFSMLTFLALVVVWLPIIAHHLWVDTRFENIAFILTVFVAVMTSTFSGVAELVFAYCTVIYRMSWSSALLVTINFVILKWQVLLSLILETTLWFTLFGTLIYQMARYSESYWLLGLLILPISSIFQIYWLSKLDKYLANIGKEDFLEKIRSIISPATS